MIVKPTVTELLKKAKNRYELVIATSKRARQIAMGDEPLTKVKEESPVTLAANEIAEGKVTIIRDMEEFKRLEKEREKLEGKKKLEESQAEETQKEESDKTETEEANEEKEEKEEKASKKETKSKKTTKTKKEE